MEKQGQLSNDPTRKKALKIKKPPGSHPQHQHTSPPHSGGLISSNQLWTRH